MTPREPIAIVGTALRLPDARSLDELAANLGAARDSVGAVPPARLALAGQPLDAKRRPLAAVSGIEEFDHEYFGISLREARLMAPEQRLALELTCAAVEDAGYAVAGLRGTKTAVVFGAGPSDYPDLIPDGEDELLELLGTGMPSLCGRISYLLGLSGPALVLDTGCSAGLVALDHATKLLRDGDCDQAVVGAVSLHSTFPAEDDPDRYAEVMASGGRSRAFDAAADGAGDGEGGAVVLLKLLSAARRDGDDIRALVVGSAVNHNGDRSNGLSAPSAAAQAEVIETAWRRAGLTPDQADYLEAHGSGTRLGDMIEIDGLRRALRTPAATLVPVGSVKTNLGHLDRAAGLAGLAKVVAQLRHEAIYPSLHFETASPLIDFANAPVAVSTSTRPWPAERARYAGVSSFSMSGTNAHAVVSGAPAPTQPASTVPDGVATVSARSRSSLVRLCTTLADHFESSAPVALGDVLRVLNCGRDHWPFRVAVPVSETGALAHGLRAAAARLASPTALAAPTMRSAVWVCPDTDSTSAEDATRLAERWPSYRAAMAECAALAREDLAADALEWFSRQYAAARLLESLGVTFAHAVGTGRGALVARSVAKRDNLAGCLRRLADGDLPEGTEPELPPWLLFESLVLCGPDPGSVIEVPPGAAALEWRSDDVLGTVAALYEHGVDISWAAQHPGPGRRVPLPTYSFEPTVVWVREPATFLSAARPAETCETGAVAVAAESCSSEAEVCSLEAEPDSSLVETGPVDAQGYERIVCTTWGEVLGRPEVSADADYFELGGTSAMALQMLTTVRRRCGVRMKLIDLYETRTAGAFAARVSQLRDGQTVAGPGIRETT